MAEDTDVLVFTADVVSAYVSNNKIGKAELVDLIASVHKALSSVDEPAPEAAPEPIKLTPAQIRKSITNDSLISFEDGRPYKTLKRHLSTHGLTIEQYRAKWGLPKDYPSTAPAYSAARSEMAKSLGLGNKKRNAEPEATTQPEAQPETQAEAAPKATRGRKKVAA